MSRNRSETVAKVLTGGTYAALHTIALLGASGLLPAVSTNFEVPSDLQKPQQWAMIAPVISVGIFSVLHWVDERRKKANNRIWGLASRAYVSDAGPGDFASSSISRLSIHSALAGGVIWAVVKLGSTLGYMTAGMMGLAVMLGMVSVLCYAQSSRWIGVPSNDPRTDPKLWTKRELLRQATRFDQFSWYALTTGLIWAVALANPNLSIVTSFVYGLLLWRFYYFRWDDKQPPNQTQPESEVEK